MMMIDVATHMLPLFCYHHTGSTRRPILMHDGLYDAVWCEDVSLSINVFPLNILRIILLFLNGFSVEFSNITLHTNRLEWLK
jgi:hypothetical protein